MLNDCFIFKNSFPSLLDKIIDVSFMRKQILFATFNHNEEAKRSLNKHHEIININKWKHPISNLQLAL